LFFDTGQNFAPFAALEKKECGWSGTEALTNLLGPGRKKEFSLGPW
jgi:hypothetical protein